MKKRRTPRRYAGGALIALGLGSILLAGCSSSSDQPGAGQTPVSSATAPSSSATAPSATGTSAGSTAPSTAAPTSTGSTSAAGPASGTAGGTATTSRPSSGSTSATVPSRVQKTNPPTKKLTKASSTVAPKVTAVLTSIRSAQVNAKNPGEISGNAVIFGLKVSNDSGHTFDLSNVVVTVAGANGDPGTEITSDPAKPLTGSARNGSSASGTYVFVVPKSQRNPITVSVTLTADTTVAVFKGNAG